MLITITPPAGLVVTLAEAKAHCRVDVSDDDALITALITAAQQQAEHRIGGALLTQTLELQLDDWPAVLELPRPPVASITSIKYIDTAGVEQTVSPSDYVLDRGPQLPVVRLLYGGAWPALRGDINGVRVRYVAGYGTGADVPASIAAWIKLAVGELYENRARSNIGTGGEIVLGFADRLLDPYRVARL